MFNWNDKITREGLIEAFHRNKKQAEGGDDPTELQILDKNDYEGTMDVLSEAFLHDPMFGWAAGLDGTDDEKKKKELQLKINRCLLGWTNRPILVGQKGIVIGAKMRSASDDDDEKKELLAGAIALMPSRYNNDTVFDTISNVVFVGAPPFFTKEKENYAPHGGERLRAMSVLPQKRKEIMKDINTDYVYIQTVGVLGDHRGKGIGGKLLRTALGVADSLKVPTCLETESKENESLYKHLGFDTAETLEMEAEGTPTKQTMWFMVRLPKP